MVTAGTVEIGTGDDDLREGSKVMLRLLARTGPQLGVVFEEDVAAGERFADDSTTKKDFSLSSTVQVADIERIELQFTPHEGDGILRQDDQWWFERLKVTVIDSVLGGTTLLDRNTHLKFTSAGTWSSGILPTYTPSPDFPTDVVLRTIYARTNGSDEQGDGTLADPYRTFQRAIRDVPLYIPAGYRYIVDISRLGSETLPVAYAMPAIKAAASLDQDVRAASPNLPGAIYRRRGAVTVQADLQLFSKIPVADCRISAGDIASLTADTKSRILTLVLNAPRPSWANDSLKGAVFAASDPSGTRDGVVASSTDTTILLSLSDKNDGTMPSRMPTAPFTLMEQSAGLVGTNPKDANGMPLAGGGSFINNVDSFAFNGIRFSNEDGPRFFCILVRSANSFYSFSYCDFASRLALQGGAQYRVIIENSFIHGGADLEFNGVTPTINACVLDGVTSWNVIPGSGYISATDTICQNFVRPFGETRPLASGNFQDPSVAAGGGAYVFTKFVLVRNSGSHGMAPKGGGSIEFTTIRGSANDAMRVDKPTGPIQLTDVELDARGSTGIPLNLLNGAYVNVNPTSIFRVNQGQADFKVGNNAAVVGGFANLAAQTDLAAGNNSQLCRLTKS